jgi:alginate O-acetyltransferase complex protein AlgI
LIDVYKNRVPAQRNPISHALYILLFPQLVAGPIVRYPDIASDLANRKHSLDLFAEGVHRFVLGLGKKIIIGNNIGLLWEFANSTENPSILLSWLGILAYALQIFYDFSGYSDMAIGLGSMFGFHLPENFNFPYFSQSITEFWRRWHITLGQWFRDYVYIPLGGNRVSSVKWIRNIFIVWFLTGFWHGANWNFCLWGLYFGIVLLIEKLFLAKLLERLPRAFRHVYALLLIIVGWSIFGLSSVTDILSYLGDMFAINGIALYNFESLYMLRSNLVLLLIAVLGAAPLFSNIYNRYSNRTSLRALVMPVFYVIVLMVSLAYIVDSSFNPFFYFRF